MNNNSDLLQSGLQDVEGKEFIIRTCKKLENIYGLACRFMLKDNRDNQFELIMVDFSDALNEMAKVIEKAGDEIYEKDLIA